MLAGTVVLCPSLDGPDPYPRAAVADLLAHSGVTALVPQIAPCPAEDDERTRAAHYVAHLALAVAGAGASPPVLPVLPGAAGALAPAVALSQRASRRAVSGYVLLDGDYPAPGGEVGEWPDAPVAYLAGPDTRDVALTHARLRDWRLVRVPQLTAAHVAEALLGLLG